MTHDVIIVGAGISGLTLARALKARGRRPLVLERSRGVGGRCATRRIEGQPVDHGPAYLHGRSRLFVEEIGSVAEATPLPGWPRSREGSGTPCRPEAFDPREQRVTYGEGINRFAKHLALGLDVRTGAEVTTLLANDAARKRTWELTLAGGETLNTRSLALTLPAPAAAALLRSMPRMPDTVSAIMPLIDLVRMVPCLTVIARYPDGVAPPPWQASFPRHSTVIHTLLHDSDKRGGAKRLILVIQARTEFSRRHIEDPPETWARTMIAAAAALHGDWIAGHDMIQAHVWRAARVDPGSELALPIAVALDAGAVLGIAGDGFHSSGGVEGAYLSGLALAERLSGMNPSP